MSHTKIRALQQWCKALVDGYKDVNITNMSSSWRDGLAFCAVIHRFRPDLINFDALSKNNVYDNNQLAFSVAESLGIAALLEAKDMLDLPVPDKLSVITYVASIYNYFKDKEKLGGPGISTYKGGNIQIGTKRHQDNDSLNTTEPKRSTPDQSEEKTKRIGSPSTRQRSPADDLCTLCRERVYLIEKQIDNGKLYHRSCFRSSRMSPTNKILSKSLFNGAGGPSASTKVESSVPGVQAKAEWQATQSDPATKVRLYEKRREQVQKAEEQLKTERQKEKELYEKRHKAPSALRNHLKNLDNQSKENSKTSLKQPSFEKDSTKAVNTAEQPSWAQTKLRKVFNDSDSSSSTTAGRDVSQRGDSPSSANERQRRESSGSPVLMGQVTSRTMEDKQFRASKTVTKSATNMEAESGKQQLVSGLLKSLANIRQRQNPAGTTSPTSSPPPPKSPSGPPPFTKLSVTQRPASPGPPTTNSFPFSQPLNSATPLSTRTTSQAPVKVISKIETQAINNTKIVQKEQPRSRARIKSVITSTPKDPVIISKTPASTATPVSTTSASSAKSKVTNENLPSSSTTKSNAPRISSEISSSSSHTASTAKSNISKITSDTSSHSSSPAKSDVSRITSESSSTHSASTAKSNISKFTSETSPSRSALPAKSNISKITSETSPSRSTSPARSNKSKATTSLQNDPPAKLGLSKATISTNTAKNDKPQSILNRIEQYSKVAAGIEKPPSEQSPKREILLNNGHKSEDRQSPLRQNAFTTPAPVTTIGVKKPLASESSKERNTVSRHVASPAAPKKSDDKPKSVYLPPPSVKAYPDKNKQISAKTGITKDIKQPSSESHQTLQKPPEKASATAYSPKKIPPIKQVAEDKKSTASPDSEFNVFSIGRTRLHPAHYTPKQNDPNPPTTTVPSKTPTTVQSLDTKINPIPKPKRQKPGLIPSTANENKENPIDNKIGSSNGVAPHKATVALSERQDVSDTSKTEWQLEAERRIAARKGKYIDPETHITRFMIPEADKQTDNEQNGDANQNPRPQAGMKKIPVSQNWTFDDDSLNSDPSLDFSYRKHVVPKEDLESLELSVSKKRLSTDEIQKELKDIDSKLTDLELRGRQLEVTIRAANEDDEKFMVEWFQLINEKNELVRRENDLIYQSQEQELEEEQIRIDKELQVLMMKPYEKKTKAEKRKEEALIRQKIAIVNQRNLIVDSIDEDRLRYEEEDEGIKEVLQNKGYLQS